MHIFCAESLDASLIICGIVHSCLSLAYDVLCDLRKELVCIISVSCKLDRLGQIKTEDTHDRFCIYCVSARSEIHVIIVC